MASLKLNLSKKNPEQLIALADLVGSKLVPAAPATPPIPNMATKAASLATAKTAAKTANDAYEGAKAALVTLKEARDAAADALRIEHTSVGAAVESEAKGNPVTLAASGYDLASATTPSGAAPAKILNLNVTQGDVDGTLDVAFDPEGNSDTYEVQVTTTDPIAGPYTTKEQPTASRCTLGGLTSGQRVWVRVRGIGSGGSGAWSDPATKIVP